MRDTVLMASVRADQENPTRLQTNRGVDCFNHITRVIELLKADGIQADYIGKTAGEGAYHPPTGFPRQVGVYTITGVSHDAIWIARAFQFDLIGGGNDGDEPLGMPGVAVANEIPMQFHRPHNPPVAHPLSGSTPPPPPAPKPTLPGREEMMKEGEWLDAFYRSAEGLKRAEGLSKGGVPDWEGVGAWLFDVYLSDRVAGKSPAEARAHVIAEIQKTDEWRSKHP